MRAEHDRDQHRDDDDADGDGDAAHAEARDGVQRDPQPEQRHTGAQQRPRRERDSRRRCRPSHRERREQHAEPHREDQRADLRDRAVQQDPAPTTRRDEREPGQQAGDPFHRPSVARRATAVRKDPPLSDSEVESCAS